MAKRTTTPQPTARRKLGRPAQSQPGSGFGARLRHFRQECGLTLGQAAERITAAGWPIDGGALHRLETGPEPPWLGKLAALAAAYECPPLLLVTPLAGEDPPPARRQRRA